MGGTAEIETVRRAIPRLIVPSLQSLGLGELARPAVAMTWMFVGRTLAAGALLGVAIARGWTSLVLATIPFLYGFCLTLVHHAIHGSLALPGRVRHAVLLVGGALVLNSGHALRRTHLQHHRTDPEGDDPEGVIETVAWSAMPVEAVLFRYRLWSWAWRRSSGPSVQHRRVRRFVTVEAALHVAVVVSALATLGSLWSGAVAIVWFADVVFAVLAGKGPQTNWGRPVSTPLVAIRCGLSRFVVLGHNWHLEHHLYPMLPLPRLGRVADRLDEILAGQDVLTVELP